MTTEYIENDIHKEILNIQDNTIDLIYTSPPYGITEAKWDKPLKWDMLFKEMWRVLKPDGIIILHSSMPFTYELLKYEKPRYHYIWKKNKLTNFFKAKLQPLRNVEEVLIYYKKPGTYNPQMTGDEVYKKKYFKCKSVNKYTGERDNIEKTYISDTETHTGKYPTTLLEYPVRVDDTGINRSDELIDYFIKSYSNEGDKILDMTCHNNYVGDRCKLLNRNYLGIDIDLKLNVT
tara:strand:- start:1392 stop:2090 length:699 start_codon:yes stop_codon:yes gene_type:complete